MLLSAGADANAQNSKESNVTPLTLVLRKGESVMRNAVRHGFETEESAKAKVHETAVKVWVRAAQLLVSRGAHWSESPVCEKGETQLFLLLSSFPPLREDASAYQFLVRSAIQAGIPLSREDDAGRSGLFVFCERMAAVRRSDFPDVAQLLRILLDACPGGGIGASDRTGRTVFDLESSVPNSCLSAVRGMLISAAKASSTKSSISTISDLSGLHILRDKHHVAWERDGDGSVSTFTDYSAPGRGMGPAGSRFRK